MFLNETGRLLPSEFLPQLKEVSPILKLDGGQMDYELPEIDDAETDIIDDFQI